MAKDGQPEAERGTTGQVDDPLVALNTEYQETFARNAALEEEVMQLGGGKVMINGLSIIQEKLDLLVEEVFFGDEIKILRFQLKFQRWFGQELDRLKSEVTKARITDLSAPTPMQMNRRGRRHGG